MHQLNISRQRSGLIVVSPSRWSRMYIWRWYGRQVPPCAWIYSVTNDGSARSRGSILPMRTSSLAPVVQSWSQFSRSSKWFSKLFLSFKNLIFVHAHAFWGGRTKWTGCRPPCPTFRKNCPTEWAICTIGERPFIKAKALNVVWLTA